MGPYKNRGFTLIELLVVIAIIGILASVVLASLNSARVKARNASYLAQIKEYQKAFEIYYSNNGSYPVPSPASWSCLGTGHPSNRCWSSPYYETDAQSISFRNLIAPYIDETVRVGPDFGRFRGLYRATDSGATYELYLVLEETGSQCPTGWIKGTSSSFSNDGVTACLYQKPL